MKRLFFALNIDDHIKNQLQLLNTELIKFSILKTVPPENFHITLQFLGDIKNEIFEEIKDQFKNINPECSIISYKLIGIGSFPETDKARVIWCGLQTDPKKINFIKNIIEDFSGHFGIQKETRAFKPHLTIARVKNNRVIPNQLKQFIQNNAQTNYGEGTFSKISLFESQLSRSGATYIEHCTIPLNRD